MNYLVLVNKDNIIDESYIKSICMVYTTNVYNELILVENKTLEMYFKLRDELIKKNIYIAIDSAYRSLSEQEDVVNEFTLKYGKEYANTYVAKVGSSEHHTGLAIDLCLIVDQVLITENDDLVKYDNIWKEIHDLLSTYGFILRYPLNKKNITGYNYEPWHIRYVGDAAVDIYNSGLCLEEYLKEENLN